MILTNLLATTKAMMIVKMMATPPVAQFVIPESVRSKGKVHRKKVKKKQVLVLPLHIHTLSKN